MSEQFIPGNDWLVVIVVSGIIGTACMTAFMYALTFLTDRVMKVTKILGTMIMCQTTEEGELSDSTSAIVAGIIGHYLVGILFVALYHTLWVLGVGKPNFLNGLILGFASGIAAVIFWFTFFAIHPYPPYVDLKTYLPTLFLAHFVFALTAMATYVFFGASFLSLP